MLAVDVGHAGSGDDLHRPELLGKHLVAAVEEVAELDDRRADRSAHGHWLGLCPSVDHLEAFLPSFGRVESADGVDLLLGSDLGFAQSLDPGDLELLESAAALQRSEVG